MKIERIKLVDIVNEDLINDELELLKGGILAVGCTHSLCYSPYCDNTHLCTDGDERCATFVV